VGGQPFSMHAEGERMSLTRAEGARQEIDLVPPAAAPPRPAAVLPVPVCPVGAVTGLGTAAVQAEPPAPGTSPLDEGLRRLRAEFADQDGGDA
jgi:hypothetical protein